MKLENVRVLPEFKDHPRLKMDHQRPQVFRVMCRQVFSTIRAASSQRHSLDWIARLLLLVWLILQHKTTGLG